MEFYLLICIFVSGFIVNALWIWCYDYLSYILPLHHLFPWWTITNTLTYTIFIFSLKTSSASSITLYESLYSFSSFFSPSDPPGCGRPHRAAGDIRPVSAPRRAVTPCAWWSTPPPPPPITVASHSLFNCFAAAAAPLPGVKHNYYLHNMKH